MNIKEVSAVDYLPSSVKRNTVPPSGLASALICPPCASTIVRQIDRPTPIPSGLAVTNGAPITHYEVCSTFDSAPHVGSIGRAIDIGTPILGGSWKPVVVG